ncbi:histidine kinase [Actinoplanes sp. SE50]|uniref:ATP-binding protein n=1 Tax=unclassified Actinoplanes TaxID=2626549 RepID=UPI00023EDCFF|nr:MULTISPECIES: ATP-binding protein [unclassified Actinoplanes]AEV89105.1 multi-sensor hybrid histidine kinase [Actinoplanes sp. SE50/110]ATO87511.1 histidine kinase [Actinoplanes sp. SE50]SLM04929.1 hybrid sensor histidine kinase/response regulator [Actinoplanes sp. SE50/110]
MGWLSKRRLARRLLVNAITIAVLVAVAVLGYSVSHRQETMAGQARQAQRLAESAQQVKFRAADFNGWQTAYALDIIRAVPGATADTSPSRAKFLDAAAKFDSELDALEVLSASSPSARTVDAVREAFEAFMTLDRTVVTLYRSGKPADRRAASELVLGREIQLYGQIANGCDATAALSAAAADTSIGRLDAVGAAIRRYILILSIVAAALTVLGAILAEARQRAIAQQAKEAQRMASLGRLAGGITHDFNNVLAIILNYTDFVAEHASPEALDDLAQIRKAAKRAAGLTAQLLCFIRHEAIQPQIFDINAAINEAHAMLARTLGEHIELVVMPSPEPLKICADTGQIQQILVNLAVNARDAMPDGGTLVIAASAVDLEENQANVHPPVAAGRYLQLLVTDTGTGMSPETVARIFEPFFTTKPKGHGTGLGLATVLDIVITAGGSIDVCSKLGIGTTFRLYFPAVDVPYGQESEGRNDVAPPRGHGQSILIVEDEPALGTSVARILAAGGYQVRSAVSGPDALAAYADDGCDLLIADVVMPDMSGSRLAEILHRTDPRLPVLYISGYIDGNLGANRLCTPETRVIEKPFTADQLLVAVGDALSPAPDENGITGGRPRPV